MANYPTAGSSMLSTWNTNRQPVNQSTQQFAMPGGAPNYSPAPAPAPYLQPGGAPAPYLQPGGAPGGSVLGASTGGGGGNTGGGRSNPSPVSNPYDNIRPPQGPSQGEIDSQFNPILDVYNQAEGNLRGQLPGLIGEAEAQAQASRGLLGNQRTGANELLSGQQQQTFQSQQAQTGQQRQTLQELQSANQQRFGGSSSAGQAAGELQGREFQKNTFQIGQQAQQAMQQINQQRQVVEREFQQGIQQLEVNKQQAVNQIQRTFQDKLLEINGRRGKTESDRASARMDALQELRNAAYQIDVSRAQFQSQLQMQARQNSASLDNQAQQFLGATDQGRQAVDTYASAPQSAIPEVTNSGQPGAQQMTGQIRRPEDLYGSIMGSSATDPRFQNFQPQFSR
ncbi:MAG: hypothetical protein M3P98_04450 [bacterium]|nr:hypothetical protein [bacterium]